jgi:hypothetical protein
MHHRPASGTIAAARAGITLYEVEVDRRGEDIDLLGILGLSDERCARANEGIRNRFKIKGDASPRTSLREIRRAVAQCARAVFATFYSPTGRRWSVSASTKARVKAGAIARRCAGRDTALKTTGHGDRRRRAGRARDEPAAGPIAGIEHVVLERGRVRGALAQRALGLAAP